MLYQDLLSNTTFIQEEPTNLSLALFQKKFTPQKIKASLEYTSQELIQCQLQIELQSKSEITHLQPLIQQCGYSLEDIQARVFTRLPVSITWKVKKSLLDQVGDTLFPLDSLSPLWLYKKGSEQPFLNLDKYYDIVCFEA